MPTTATENGRRRPSQWQVRANAYQKQKEIREADERYERLVGSIYPRTRTFHVTGAEAVNAEGDALEALIALPTTLTLVTPDIADPSQDDLYIGTWPVRRENYSFDASYRRVRFSTQDPEGNIIRGTLDFTEGRTQVHGLVDYRDQGITFTGTIKPQRYRMNVGLNAAYLDTSGGGNVIRWDRESARWKQAQWSSDFKDIAMTWGVKREPPDTPGLPDKHVFTAWFDSERHKTQWKPRESIYSGALKGTADGDELTFDLMSDYEPELSGHEWSWYPTSLRAHMDPWADDFYGGMVTWKYEDMQMRPAVFGIHGRWDRGAAAGLYRLQTPGDPARTHLVIGVFDGRLYVGDTVVADSILEGRVLSWTDLPASLRGLGLPRRGELEFSADGEHIVGAARGFRGVRLHAGDSERPEPTVPGAALFAAEPIADRADDQLSIEELMNMASTVRDPDNALRQKFQTQAMTDVHKILLNYMDSDLRKQFLMVNPPTLDGELRQIALTPGIDKEGHSVEPIQWYSSQTHAFLCGALYEASPDSFADKINGKRANAALNWSFGEQGVPSLHSRMAYVRHFRKEYPKIDKYLVDQDNSKWDVHINAKFDQLIKDYWAHSVDNEADKQTTQDLVNDLENLRNYCRSKRRFWALAVFSTAVSVTKLNRLYTMATNGTDSSRIAEECNHVQALLGIVDTDGVFAKEYGKVLAYFHLTVLVPALAKMEGGDWLYYQIRDMVTTFVEEYKNGKDTELADLAKQMAEEITEDRMREMARMLAMSHVAGGSWTHIVGRFTNAVVKKFGQAMSAIARWMCVAAGFMIIVFVAQGTISWDRMDPGTRGLMVIGAIRSVAQAIHLLARGVIGISELWKNIGIHWRNIGHKFRGQALEDVVKLNLTGFWKWIGRNTIAKSVAQETMNDMVVAGTRVMTRGRMFKLLLGANASEFLAIRLGAILSFISLVLIVWSMVESSDANSMVKAANWIFFASALIEFIAAASGWILVTVTTALTPLVASVLTLVGIIGFALMIAGIVLMIIGMQQPTESPTEKYIKSCPFYREKGYDIDDFEVFVPKNIRDEYVAVSLTDPNNYDRCVVLKHDGKVDVGKYDSSGATGLLCYTDHLGRAQFFGRLIPGDNCDEMVMHGVAVSSGGVLVSLAQGSDQSQPMLGDERFMWRAVPTGGAEWAEKETPKPNDGRNFPRRQSKSAVLTAGNFRFYNEYWHKTKGVKRFLQITGSGWALTDNENAAGTEIRVMSRKMKPQCLKVDNTVWYTKQHDMRIYPSLLVEGSRPYRFTISPALPTNVNLDPVSGHIYMSTGLDVPAHSAQNYTLVLTDPAGNETLAAFTLEIKEGYPPQPDQTPVSTWQSAATDRAQELFGYVPNQYDNPVGKHLASLMGTMIRASVPGKTPGRDMLGDSHPEEPWNRLLFGDRATYSTPVFLTTRNIQWESLAVAKVCQRIGQATDVPGHSLNWAAIDWHLKSHEDHIKANDGLHLYAGALEQIESPLRPILASYDLRQQVKGLYTERLFSPAWLNACVTKWKTGTWPNWEWELFQHVAKVYSLGGGDIERRLRQALADAGGPPVNTAPYTAWFVPWSENDLTDADRILTATVARKVGMRVVEVPNCFAKAFVQSGQPGARWMI